MRDEILSILRNAPTSRFVYSSLGFHAPTRAGELPGPWFTAALGALGIEETAVRQTLYRMEREGALVTRRAGRVKVYAPTSTTLAIIEAGTAKMLAAPERQWDGAWTLVHFRFDQETREMRDRFRDVLRVEGFGNLGPGLYVHPRDRSNRLREAVTGWDLAGRLHVFRGPRHPGELDDRTFAARIWNLTDIAARYTRFLTTFTSQRRRRHWSPIEAAAVRFALVFDFLEIAWDDPELAPALLPKNWPGHRARQLVGDLYQRLAPSAKAFGDSITQQLHLPPSAQPPAPRRKRSPA